MPCRAIGRYYSYDRGGGWGIGCTRRWRYTKSPLASVSLCVARLPVQCAPRICFIYRFPAYFCTLPVFYLFMFVIFPFFLSSLFSMHALVGARYLLTHNTHTHSGSGNGGVDERTNATRERERGQERRREPGKRMETEEGRKRALESATPGKNLSTKDHALPSRTRHHLCRQKLGACR